MIIFYNKKTGDVFGTIHGRVHDQQQMGMGMATRDVSAKDAGRLIIGWEATNELEDYEEEIEVMQEVGENLFKKVKTTEIRQRTKMKEHNLDKFDILQRFEDDTPENPLDYRVENNNLIKK